VAIAVALVVGVGRDEGVGADVVEADEKGSRVITGVALLKERD
jgi:hypothetical protein